MEGAAGHFRSSLIGHSSIEGCSTHCHDETPKTSLDKVQPQHRAHHLRYLNRLKQSKNVEFKAKKLQMDHLVTGAGPQWVYNSSDTGGMLECGLRIYTVFNEWTEKTSDAERR